MIRFKQTEQQAKITAISEAEDGMPVYRVVFEPYGAGLGGATDEWRDDEVA